MGKATGFKEFQRETVPYRDAAARVLDLRKSIPNPMTSNSAPRAPAVWIAACRFVKATTVVPFQI